MSYSFLRYLLKERADKASAHRKGTLSSALGFTMIELLVVIIIAGVLAAIAAPSWLALTNRQRLGTSQNSAYTAIRAAQSNAKRDNRPWQVSFRNNTSNRAQWAVHLSTPSSAPALTAADWNALPWQDFDSVVRIAKDTDSPAPTTLPKITPAPGSEVYTAQFNAKGEPTNIPNIPSRVTLTTTPNAGTRKVCVVISTLLGSLSSKSDGDCN
jgi:prepilin-type N-terminal cleavage/methylation domain-containing protein